MTDDANKTRRARERIDAAVARLAERYPFHAGVLGRFGVVPRPQVGTVAVTVSGGRLLLLYNADFVLGLGDGELGGALLHEVHHVVLGHLTMCPRKYPDEWARVVAQEVTVNEFVREPLPAGAIRLEAFRSLSPLQSTAQRYHILTRARRRGQLLLPTGRVIATPGKASAEARQRRVIDDHSVWDNARADAQGLRDALRGVVQQAADEAGPQSLPAELATALRALGVGTRKGSRREPVKDARPGGLDWRAQLRLYVGRVVEASPSFLRPPRRFPDLVGVVPGRRYHAHKPRVMAVFDTSASIDALLMGQIQDELAGLARYFDVLVVECDAAVQRVYPYQRVAYVWGRGGTDLRPPLRGAFLARHRPDVIVFFTDGFGPAPDHPPPVPVVWCLSPAGRTPAPWGRVIRMQG